MKRKSIVAAASLAAGLGLYNRRVTLPYSTLSRQLPVQPTMWQWRYGKIAVYEAGAPTNPPLLLLHGHNAAASAAEMRGLFTRLSDHFHVYAPDLLGYGLSDRPDVSYIPLLYVEFIQEILREVVQRPAAVVASSLTASHAIEAAQGDPEWITGLVLICPTGIRRLTRQSTAGKLVESLLSVPVLGEAMFNGIASRASIRYFLKAQTYFNPDLVTDDLVDEYYATAHVPGARHAPSAFVSGKLYWDAGDAWSRLEQRPLLVWGREATITPASDAAAFLATNPAAELQTVSPAGILPHDEQPEQTANIIRRWLLP